ncbi:hypothetical protein ACLOJK_008708 [Asimina triloba]
MNYFIPALSFLTVHLWASMAQPPTAIINNVSSRGFVTDPQPPDWTRTISGVFFLNSNSSIWSNNNSIIQYKSFIDDSEVRFILSRGMFNPSYSCGFFCTRPCSSYFFGVIAGGNPGNTLVWTPNRDNPVKQNAALELTYDGDLVLWDADGTRVWSSDTAGRSVAGMNITAQGNLVLFDDRNETVWQSFDYPADVLLTGQTLHGGQSLSASHPAGNETYYASTTSSGFAAFVEEGTLSMYYQWQVNEESTTGQISNLSTKPMDMTFDMGNLILKSGNNLINRVISDTNPPRTSYQYIRLKSDGRLVLCQWTQRGWVGEADLVADDIDECQRPLICGEFGVCKGGECSCPVGLDGKEYFKPLEGEVPSNGCYRITPLSCELSLRNEHHLVDFGNLSYFNLIDQNAAASGLNDLDVCKQACLRNCSCEALFFKHSSNFSRGDCYIISHVLSIRARPIPSSGFSSSAFIKIRIRYEAPSPEPSSRSAPDNLPPPTPGKRTNLALILAGSSGGIVLIILLMIIVIMFSRKERAEAAGQSFNLVPGIPMKFSHDDLRVATEDFKEMLGRGGFGSVFKGRLADGTHVAVKRLDNSGQGVNEFLAEVETIGSIHHINLVRLVGFCAENEHRLLVYEYMSNGSLDNWIFNRNQNPILSWQTRKQIILDIAKGLSYLHEECRQRIVHLDIKPQNILLDDNFNAKVSDFGLSLLIDRDQSQVLVNMRGTPGYLAPEWRRLRINVKADIYSFGIVVLEIVCGRRNLDRSRAESSAHLLGMLEQKAAEDRLIDIVDGTSEDVLLHGEEAIQMIRTAAWCLQNDHTRRPLMSDVVKVLEGVMQVEPTISYQFSNATAPATEIEGFVLASSEPPEASILSAPR